MHLDEVVGVIQPALSKLEKELVGEVVGLGFGVRGGFIGAGDVGFIGRPGATDRGGRGSEEPWERQGHRWRHQVVWAAGRWWQPGEFSFGNQGSFFFLLEARVVCGRC
jgi:hypothetical protein